MELKISEYAKINRVTSRTVWNWIKQGRIKTRYTNTGRVRVIVESDKEKQVELPLKHALVVTLEEFERFMDENPDFMEDILKL